MRQSLKETLQVQGPCTVLVGGELTVPVQLYSLLQVLNTFPVLYCKYIPVSTGKPEPRALYEAEQAEKRTFLTPGLHAKKNTRSLPLFQSFTHKHTIVSCPKNSESLGKLSFQDAMQHIPLTLTLTDICALPTALASTGMMRDRGYGSTALQ